MIEVDVVLDLSRGDCGKGKVSHALLSKGGYTHSIRFNGGGNAGHTIFHNDKKFVTHQIPAGVFYGIRSIIGPGCVINPKKLKEEIDYLESNGIPVKGLLAIAKNAHVITSEHLEEDCRDVLIGTTKTGNGPCYTDKYGRRGLQAHQCPELREMTIDMFQEFYASKEPCVVLAEGAQGFYLDVDWGAYPYVTSSHCGIGSVLLNGFSHKQVRKVYGVAKAYETYVGKMDFEKGDPMMAKLRELGNEFGATTGRPRQCNWLNLDELIQAAKMNGVDEIYINKIDILDALGEWNLFMKDVEPWGFPSSKQFQQWIRDEIKKEGLDCKIFFSGNPHDLT